MNENLIRNLSDSDLKDIYAKWQNYMFRYILIMHDEIVTRNLEINVQVETYIKSEVKKIKIFYKSLSNNELKLEFQNFENLDYCHQLYLEKEIENRKIKISVNEKIDNNKFHKFIFLTFIILVQILVYLTNFSINLNNSLLINNMLSSLIINFIFSFIKTIPYFMLLQINSQYYFYLKNSNTYWDISFYKVFYISFYFSLIRLVFNIITEINIWLGIVVVIAFFYKTVYVPFIIYEEGLDLSFAIQKSFHMTKKIKKENILIFFLNLSFLIVFILINFLTYYFSFYTGIFVQVILTLIGFILLKITFKVLKKLM